MGGFCGASRVVTACEGSGCGPESVETVRSHGSGAVQQEQRAHQLVPTD